MIWKPHVTVATITHQNNRFLMVEEKCDGDIVLNQPAGHLEEGESLIEAAVRETLEETAWHVKITSFTGIYQWRQPVSGESYLRFSFTADPVREEPSRTLDGDILRALWMSRDDLLEKHNQLRSPMVLKGIDDYLAGQSFSLDRYTVLG